MHQAARPRTPWAHRRSARTPCGHRPDLNPDARPPRHTPAPGARPPGSDTADCDTPPPPLTRRFAGARQASGARPSRPLWPPGCRRTGRRWRCPRARSPTDVSSALRTAASSSCRTDGTSADPSPAALAARPPSDRPAAGRTAAPGRMAARSSRARLPPTRRRLRSRGGSGRPTTSGRQPGMGTRPPPGTRPRWPYGRRGLDRLRPYSRSCAHADPAGRMPRARPPPGTAAPRACPPRPHGRPPPHTAGRRARVCSRSTGPLRFVVATCVRLGS